MLTYSRISYLISPYLRFPPRIQDPKLSHNVMKLNIEFCRRIYCDGMKREFVRYENI